LLTDEGGEDYSMGSRAGAGVIKNPNLNRTQPLTAPTCRLYRWGRSGSPCGGRCDVASFGFCGRGGPPSPLYPGPNVFRFIGLAQIVFRKIVIVEGLRLKSSF
jgi:hypothetical protein